MRMQGTCSEWYVHPGPLIDWQLTNLAVDAGEGPLQAGDLATNQGTSFLRVDVSAVPTLYYLVIDIWPTQRMGARVTAGETTEGT